LRYNFTHYFIFDLNIFKHAFETNDLYAPYNARYRRRGRACPCPILKNQHFQKLWIILGNRGFILGTVDSFWATVDSFWQITILGKTGCSLPMSPMHMVANDLKHIQFKIWKLLNNIVSLMMGYLAHPFNFLFLHFHNITKLTYSILTTYCYKCPPAHNQIPLMDWPVVMAIRLYCCMPFILLFLNLHR